MTGYSFQQLSLVIFAGWLSNPSDMHPNEHIADPKVSAINQVCFSSDRMVVFQIIDDGILAHVCPADMGEFGFRCQTEGDLVFLPVKPSENDYVDDQKVILPANKCFLADGVYSYFTKDKTKRRVRKIKIIDAQPDKP